MIAPPNPSTGKDLSPRDRLIEAATSLFCRFGINAVGVDAVVEAAGTAKTTLYKIFGSKDGLVEAVLHAEGERWRTWFTEALEREGGTPQDKLQRIFPILECWFSNESFFGCPFINAVGEHDKTDERMRALALSHKQLVHAKVSGLLAEAGIAEPENLVLQIAMLVDGAIVAAMITRDPRVARAAGQACDTLIATEIRRLAA